MTDKKDIYKMNLHDEIEIETNFYIVRVPGGWIYRADCEQAGGYWSVMQTFVPYHNEFQDTP